MTPLTTALAVAELLTVCETVADLLAVELYETEDVWEDEVDLLAVALMDAVAVCGGVFDLLAVAEPVPVELVEPVPVWLPVLDELTVLVAVTVCEEVTESLLELVPVGDPELDWLPVLAALGEPLPVEDDVGDDELVGPAHSYTMAKRL